MQSERGLVREHARQLRPEPDHGEVFMVARRKVHEAVHAASHPNDAPRSQMVREQLRRVAGGSRLLGREVPILGSGDLVERVPVGRSIRHLSHTQTLSNTLVVCKIPESRSTQLQLSFSFVRHLLCGRGWPEDEEGDVVEATPVVAPDLREHHGIQPPTLDHDLHARTAASSISCQVRPSRPNGVELHSAARSAAMPRRALPSYLRHRIHRRALRANP